MHPRPIPETSPAPTAWHTLKLETVVTELRTDLETGLTESEAQQRLKQVGPVVVGRNCGPLALARHGGLDGRLAFQDILTLIRK